MFPRKWFLFACTRPTTIWRVARILQQCNIYGELHENEHGTWLLVEDRPNLMLALGSGAELVDYGPADTGTG